MKMELDEFKSKWAEQDRKLDASLRLNRQLLSESRLNRAKPALQRLTLGLAVETAITFVPVVALGDFIYANWAMPRFTLPAIALDLFTIAIFSSLIRQMIGAMQIDYSKPITVLQKQIEALRILHIRHLQGIFLGAPLVWIPLLIVTLKGCLGLDTYRLFSSAWLVANLLFGLAFIPLAIGLSKRFGDRWGRYPLVQRLRNDLMGQNLNAAMGFLATLSEFESGTERHPDPEAL
jgi:hypothetical protein